MRGRLTALAAFAALVVALTLPASALAASPVVERFHDKGSVTIDPNELCGFSGSSVITFNNTLTFYEDGSFKAAGSFSEVFTADDGKVVRISSAGTFTDAAVIVDEEAGTITFTATYKGLPELIKGAHSRTLVRDAGIIVFIDVLDLETFDLISSEVIQRGPHPEADSDFTLFCEAVTDALS
jgi:hypothetical protein